MRRATGIIIGILLGAIAAGLSVGFFLFKANADREKLAAQLTETAQAAQTAREQNQQAIQEANSKLQNANSEISKAQALILALEEERKIMAGAEPLIPSNSRKNWMEVIGLEQGIALKVPKGNRILTNDKQALIIEKEKSSPYTDARWLSIMPYDKTVEENLKKTFATSSAVAYTVNGRVLDGYKGTAPPENKMMLVLRIRYGGEFTHLLWARSESYVKIDDLVEILSTLHFQ